MDHPNSDISFTTRVLVISGPSGVGKMTLVQHVLAEFNGVFRVGVSVTTRKPRPGEVNGKDYHFVTEQEFTRKIEHGHFIEHKMVHGFRYGTLRKELTKAGEAGQILLAELDVQGSEALLADSMVSRDLCRIFITVTDPRDLYERILRRHGKKEIRADDVLTRVENAVVEMAFAHQFDFVVKNDALDKAKADICDVVDFYLTCGKLPVRMTKG